MTEKKKKKQGKFMEADSISRFKGGLDKLMDIIWSVTKY